MRGLTKEGKKERRRKGFTLIELMIVIAIIAILAGFALTAYKGYITKAKLTRDMLPKVKACAEDIVTYCVNNPTASSVSINTTNTPNCNSTIMNLPSSFSCSNGAPSGTITISNTTNGHTASCTVDSNGIDCNVR